MVKKHVTIDDLAGMVKRGFDAVDLRFNKVDERFSRIERLEEEVRDIKNLFAVK